MQKLGELLEWHRRECGDHASCFGSRAHYEANTETGHTFEVHRSGHLWFWDLWKPWTRGEDGRAVRRSENAAGEASTRKQAIADAEEHWSTR
jgi:hypothetical protein